MSVAADQIVSSFVGFGRTLRAAGVAADPQRMHAMVSAVSHLDVTSREDVYWAGRVTLCGNREELARYDHAFRAYFGNLAVPLRRRVQPVEIPQALSVPDLELAAKGTAEKSTLSSTASRLETLRHRDLATLTEAERADVRKLIAAIDPLGEPRRSRRYRPSSGGTVDVRRTVRAVLANGGEVTGLHRRTPTTRPRRLVLIIDVSGSMQPYADPFLRLAHAAARRRASTEVFTVGTRLTRVTRELRLREPGAALSALSQTVPDWSGGTRLGDLLKLFLDRWGQRGMARGAVVVIASDGWERGAADLLGTQMARLHRLAHRVVWANPHRGKPGYAPMTGGMLAALPFADNFVDGHSLAALQVLAAVVSGELADA